MQILNAHGGRQPHWGFSPGLGGQFDMTGSKDSTHFEPESSCADGTALTVDLPTRRILGIAPFPSTKARLSGMNPARSQPAWAGFLRLS